MTKTMKKLFLTLILAMTAFTCFAEADFTSKLDGYNCKFWLGYGPYTAAEAMKEASERAEQAKEYGNTLKETKVLLYDDLRLEFQVLFDGSEYSYVAIKCDDDVNSTILIYLIGERDDFFGCSNSKFYVAIFEKTGE